MSVKDERLYNLARLAIDVALEAPLKPNKYVARVGIPVETVAAIRVEAERLGIDWRAHHRQTPKPKALTPG